MNSPSEKQIKEDPIERRPRRGWRRIRLWEKKRGTHQTGSSWWGGAGETIFFAVMFLIGIAALTQLVWLRVMAGEVSFLTSNWGIILSVLILGSLIVMGAIGSIYGVIQIGTSAERRAAIVKRAADNELLAEVKQSSPSLPTIPDDTNWRNSPGIRLTYRLPAATSANWRIVVVSSFALAWNGAVAVLAVLAFNRGEQEAGWNMLTPEAWSLFRVVVVGYFLVGCLAIRSLLRLSYEATVIGPTNVEISALPLYAGQQYQLFLSQAGHFKIEWLEIRLVCEEEVSFSDGTDTRLESCRVHDVAVVRQEDFEVSPSSPFQCDFTLEIPADAMHSFVAPNNALIWKLVVQIQPKEEKSKTKWSRFGRQLKARLKRFYRSSRDSGRQIERVYPLILHPTNKLHL